MNIYKGLQKGIRN